MCCQIEKMDQGKKVLSSIVNQHMRVQDEGVKLREELNYREFYPDLEVNDLVIFKKSDEKEKIDNASNDELVDVNDYLSDWKQLIIKDTITLERLGPQIKLAEYKKCTVKVSQLNSLGRINKQYLRYGYRNENKNLNEIHKRSYSKKTDLSLRHKNDFFSEISIYQVNFKVEYDMDEQDELFLRHLNEKLIGQSRLLSNEVFEILVTVLENEAFHLEKKVPPRVSPNSNTNTHESHAAWKHHDLYGSDDGTGYPLDQPCAVCGGTDCDNSNAIVFCDGCDIAVHQECYGVVFIPEGQWLCRRCMISKNRKIDCLFCPSLTGAFKQTDNGCWGHVVCGIWIPELYFGNLHYMEPIGGMEYIPKSRWRLTCYICKQDKGACIQCSNKNCFAAYHTTCAKRAGFYMKFKDCTILEAASKNFPPGSCLESFCHKHSPSSWSNCLEGIKKTRDYFTHLNESQNIENRLPDENKHSNRYPNNRWKSSRGTLIAPQYFADIIQKVLKKFSINNAEKISIDLCKYWTMKRELKRGAPLVRIFNPSSLNTLSTDELANRISFSEILLDDLVSLESLAETFVSKLKCDVARKINRSLIDSIAFHPVRYILETVVWDKISKTESFKSLYALQLQSDEDKLLFDIQKKLHSDEYTSIQDFERDFTFKMAAFIDRDPIPRSVISLCTKVLKDFNKLISRINNLDIAALLRDDFEIDVASHEVHEIAWKGRKQMEIEELSDVEELSIKEERLLKGFIRY